jgi:hypothetical protein
MGSVLVRKFGMAIPSVRRYGSALAGMSFSATTLMVKVPYPPSTNKLDIATKRDYGLNVMLVAVAPLFATLIFLVTSCVDFIGKAVKPV